MQQMALSAQQLLSAPERNVAQLKVLTALAADDDVHIARLAMLSCLAVFKDILPGYRIRPPTEQELQVGCEVMIQQRNTYGSVLSRGVWRRKFWRSQ